MNQSILDRFWSKVNKNTDSGCWEWTAGKSRQGYGVFYPQSTNPTKAHRFSWIVRNGAIPTGLCCCHSCDNPSCVNPDHLWLGTNYDNIMDRVKKGRSPSKKGELNQSAKLTQAEVEEIRMWHSIGECTNVSLSKVYKVSPTAIGRVVNNRTWT